MLLLVILILLTIIGFIIFACDINFWDTEFIEMIGALLGVANGIITIVAIFILIINLIIAPGTQALYEERYNELIYRVEHIDSFNREEVVERVNQWNKKYRENSYGKKSPWIGVFYTIDTSTTSLIDLNGGTNEQ